MSLYIDRVPHTLTGEQHAILWSLLLQRLETQPTGPRRRTMETLRDQMDHAARAATLNSDTSGSVTKTVRLIGDDDTPLSHAFRRSLLREDIDNDDEAA